MLKSRDLAEKKSEKREAGGGALIRWRVRTHLALARARSPAEYGRREHIFRQVEDDIYHTRTAVGICKNQRVPPGAGMFLGPVLLRCLKRYQRCAPRHGLPLFFFCFGGSAVALENPIVRGKVGVRCLYQAGAINRARFCLLGLTSQRFEIMLMFMLWVVAYDVSVRCAPELVHCAFGR